MRRLLPRDGGKEEVMGMFDYIKCEYPLPDGGPQDGEFQTKDTDAMYLECYRITKEGRLIHETVRYEIVEPEEREYPDPNDLRHFIGMMRSIPCGDKDTNFHGDLRYYTDIDGEWLE